METNARLQALSRLAESTTDAAKTALTAELDEATTTLETNSKYEQLSRSLDVLGVIGYRFSDRAVNVIAGFVQTIEQRKLAYSHAHEAFADYIAQYSSAQSLITKALDVVSRLRYLEPTGVLRILLSLHGHPSDAVRQKVRSSLDSLAKYDLDVFYGVDRKGGLGAAPQAAILELLESLDEKALKANHEAASQLLTSMLATIAEGVSSTYASITISQSALPAIPSVADVRSRSIKLLCRLYFLAGTTQQKLSAINSLSEATRTDSRVSSESTAAMIASDSVEVLRFFEAVVRTADFQTMQKIESNTYWIFVHAATAAVKAAALKVEQAIAENSEYAIYRTLIGFEGIFGEWSTYEKVSSDFESIEKSRRQRASEYAHAINPKNYDKWRTRILEYAKTESDDLATFPVFYHFLGEFGSAQPRLALTLITEDTDALARFLIPILSSLWNGPERRRARKLIERWMRDASAGRPYLFAATRTFLSTKELDVPLLRQLLKKATEIKDIATVRQIVAVAIARWEDAAHAVPKYLLFPALDVLTEVGDARWIFEAWFRKEAKRLFAQMDSDGLERVLRNLRVLNKIDFHAEEVLYGLAQRAPDRVMRFLVERITAEQQSRSKISDRSFEAIPFGFNKLQEPLSRIPGTVVRTMLEHYDADPSLFTYRGGRLLKNIFPKFPKEFEAELLQLVRGGKESDLEFVLAVLKNYQGESSVYDVCKEIIRLVHSHHSLLSEVASVLSATGVVSGEFGFAEAYERKRHEVSGWLSDPNDKIKAFATRYMAELEQMRDAEMKRAKEDLALKKHRFGEQT